MRPPKYCIYAMLLRAPPLDILRHPTMQKYNAGARVLIIDGKLYFLSTVHHVCSMSVSLARWFNWTYPIEADLAGIANDLDDPFSDNIYYKPYNVKED